MNDTTFEELVLKSPVPVMVDFWAPWCGPCRMIAPLIDELAVEYGDKLRAVRFLPVFVSWARQGAGQAECLGPWAGVPHLPQFRTQSCECSSLLALQCLSAQALVAASCADLACGRGAAEAEHRREPWDCD